MSAWVSSVGKFGPKDVPIISVVRLLKEHLGKFKLEVKGDSERVGVSSEVVARTT